MAIHMENTQITPEKTIGEIQKVLSKGGAKKVITEYEDGEPCGLMFSVMAGDKELVYKLPVRTKWLFKYLQAKRTYPGDKKEKDLAQAKRIGWRLILRWLQAQLAFAQEAKMVDIKEVFLSYGWDYESKMTVYEQFAKKEGIPLLEYVEAEEPK